MSNTLPGPLRDLVEQFSSFPGVGPKSALRMAMTLLKWPEEKTRDLGRRIQKLRDSLCICSQCRTLSDSDPCTICLDPGRSNGQLCIVAEWDSLLSMEEAGFFRGRYFVLGGLLSPLEGVSSRNLEIDALHDRLGRGDINEVILALGTIMEAENTGSFLRDMLEKKFPHITLTRLAQGIPLGSELKYIDRDTLRQSLEYRQNF
ncbi:MAG: recombination mediator RecR [Desulfonatronovibrionaceae bacterium]